MIKTLSIFILFLLFLFEIRAEPVGVHYRIELKQCKVLSKTFDKCTGSGRMCSNIVMNCLDSFPWYYTKKVSSTMYADEVTWVVPEAVIDCTMYVLTNGATKISNGTLIYLDGEPVLLGNKYSVHSFPVDPMYLIGFLLFGTIVGMILALQRIFSKVTGKSHIHPSEGGAGDLSPAPPTSPKTYTGSGLNERGKHKRPDAIPALGFEDEKI